MERLLGFDPQLLFDAFVTGINVFILFFALSYLLFNTCVMFWREEDRRLPGN